MLPRFLVNTLFVLISCASVEAFRIHHERKRSRHVVNMDQDARTLSAPKAEPKARTTISLAEEKEAKAQPARARAAARMHRSGKKRLKLHAHSINATNDQVYGPPRSPWLQRFVSLTPFKVHIGVADGFVGVPALKGAKNDMRRGDELEVWFPTKMAVTVSAAFQYKAREETGMLILQYAASAATRKLFWAKVAAVAASTHASVASAVLAHTAMIGMAAAAGFTLCPLCAWIFALVALGVMFTAAETVETYATNFAYSMTFFYMSSIVRRSIAAHHNLDRDGREILETWRVGPRNDFRDISLIKVSSLLELLGRDATISYVKEAFDQATRFKVHSGNHTEIYMLENVVQDFLHEMHTWGIYQESLWPNIQSGENTVYVCAGFQSPMVTEARRHEQPSATRSQGRSQTPPGARARRPLTPIAVRMQGDPENRQRERPPSTPRGTVPRRRIPVSSLVNLSANLPTPALAPEDPALLGRLGAPPDLTSTGAFSGTDSTANTFRYIFTSSSTARESTRQRAESRQLGELQWIPVVWNYLPLSFQPSEADCDQFVADIIYDL